MTEVARSVLLAVLLAGCTSATPQGTPAPTPTPFSIVMQGTGIGQSVSFLLDAGTYGIAWQTNDVGRFVPEECYMGLTVQKDGGGFYEILANDTFPAMTAPQFTNLHNVPAGSFFIGSSSDCGWLVLFDRE
jgi:hypothetical protein